ncbi:MAG: hypothetical protein ACPG45_05310 [Flavobacteriaceae bacterium]
MKIKLFLLCCLFSFSVQSQVGIATTNPQAMLDINGDLSVQLINNGTVLATENSVLIVDRNDNNIFKKVSSEDVVNSYLKSLVKGSFSGSSTGITISSLSWNTIPFDNEDIDKNNEYNTSSYDFTALQNGIYEVYSQIKIDPVSAGDFGIGVFKVVSGTETLMAEENYAGVQVLSVNVSSPYRRVTTVIELNAGESIRFKVYSLASVTLTGGGNSFFKIKQIR